MKYLFSIICFIQISNCIAQKRPINFYKETPRETLAAEICYECFFSEKYTKAERKHFYPFNKAANVRLISFKEGQNIPVSHEILNESKVIEQITLTNSRVDSLTNLFYNVGYTPIKTPIRIDNPGASCYEPRNGILFVNSSGRVFAYLEICFACERTRKSSKYINDGEYCSTKFDLLRRFFFSEGIKYGTGERYPILSYHEIFKLDTLQAINAIKDKFFQKTNNGKDTAKLNAIEKKLFFALNAFDIYYPNFENGLTQFYFNISGNYYDQTLKNLKMIGATLTYKALQRSAKDWPRSNIPTNMSKRRIVLLSIVNKAEPRWKILVDGLFDHQEEVGAEYLIPKEDINGLILSYANKHLNDLTD